MPGIFLTQRFSSGESRCDYLVENDEETIEPINWYLYNSDGGEGAITIKRECDPSRETGHHAAILSLCLCSVFISPTCTSTNKHIYRCSI